MGVQKRKRNALKMFEATKRDTLKRLKAGKTRALKIFDAGFKHVVQNKSKCNPFESHLPAVIRTKRENIEKYDQLSDKLKEMTKCPGWINPDALLSKINDTDVKAPTIGNLLIPEMTRRFVDLQKRLKPSKAMMAEYEKQLSAKMAAMPGKTQPNVMQKRHSAASPRASAAAARRRYVD